MFEPGIGKIAKVLIFRGYLVQILSPMIVFNSDLSKSDQISNKTAYLLFD